MTTLEEVRRMDCEQRLNATEFAVEDGDSFAQLTLWREWSESKRVKWEQVGSGFMRQLGELGGRPINLQLSWELIDGRLVLFHHGCSQLVDHKLIEDWLRSRLPQLYPESGRSRTTDPMNFGNVVHAIRDLNASGVGVDAKPIDTRQLKQTLEAATRCLQRNDWGTAFDRVQDALALLPDGVMASDGGQHGE